MEKIEPYQCAIEHQYIIRFASGLHFEMDQARVQDKKKYC